jgi:hypothetical protein
MKSKFLLVAVLLMGSQFAVAASSSYDSDSVDQQQDEAPVTIGRSNRNVRKSSTSKVSRIIPQASVLVSNFTRSGESANSKTGFGIGAVADIGHSDFVFETGLLYRQLGAAGSTDLVDIVVNLNYLTVPIVGKYYFSGQNTNSAYIKLGLLPSILVSKEATASALGLSASTSNFDVKTFDLGPVAGLGGKIGMNDTTSMIIEANYYRGLTKITESEIYNSAFTLTAGIALDL